MYSLEKSVNFVICKCLEPKTCNWITLGDIPTCPVFQRYLNMFAHSFLNFVTALLRLIYIPSNSLKVYILMGQSVFTGCITIITFNFKTPSSPQGESPQPPAVISTPIFLQTPSALVDHQSTSYRYEFSYCGHFIKMKSFNMWFYDRLLSFSMFACFQDSSRLCSIPSLLFFFNIILKNYLTVPGSWLQHTGSQSPLQHEGSVVTASELSPVSCGI